MVELVEVTKSGLRSAILAARRAMTGDERRAESEALRANVAALVRPGDTVCAYVPVGSEPGSPAMLEALVAAGARVLLPVARKDDSGTPLPLSWGKYRERQLVEASFGLREPRPPWSSPEAVGSASIILVPALAVDREGVRLGRGAGFYDRSLPLAGAGAMLIAVVRDDELVDHLPGEAHDVPMTHALTPGHGVVKLGDVPGHAGMAKPT
jgi:5-formyltetrahydrofolate cyclo-ligase